MSSRKNDRPTPAGPYRLPRCDESQWQFALTLDERQALVRRIMNEGLGAIDEFIREHGDESGNLARHLERIRDALVGEAKRLKKRLETLAARKKKAVEGRFKRKRDALSEREQILDAKLGKWDRLRPGRLELALKEDELIREILDFDRSQLKWYQRAQIWLKRLWKRFIALMRWLAMAIGRFFLRLFSRKYREKEHAAAKAEEARAKRPFKMVLDNPELASLFERFDVKFDNALFVSDRLQHFVDREIGDRPGDRDSEEIPASERRGAMRGKERRDYLRSAEAAMERYLEEKLARQRRELRKEREEMEAEHEALAAKEHALEEEREEAERAIEERRAEAERALEKRLEQERETAMKRDILRSLQTAGLVERRDGQWAMTAHIIDKFAEIILSDELEQMGVRKHLQRGGSSRAQGYYEQRRLRTHAELSRMDIVSSMINARLNHPSDPHIDDRDILTRVDMRRRGTHVIIAFDRSGSMDEHQRLLAAKRAALALYKIARQRHRTSRVDIIAFDTKAQRCDLETVWESTPHGFTNTGEALALAAGQFERAGSDEKYLYIITDGLPEAYTSPRDQKRYAGDLERSMASAEKRANHLAKLPNLHTTMVLLEVTDEQYIDAAKMLAEVLDARIIFTDPKKLAGEVLVDFITSEEAYHQ